MELLNAEPLLQCDENRWDARCEQSVALIGAMQSFAEGQGCDWTVKRSYIDEAHSQRPPKYQYIEANALNNLIEGTCDLKNGTDIGFMAKRPPSEQSMAIVAYGQGYATPSGTYLVKRSYSSSGSSLPPPRATSGSGSRRAGARKEKPPCSCSTRRATTSRLPRSSGNAENSPAALTAKIII